MCTLLPRTTTTYKHSNFLIKELKSVRKTSVVGCIRQRSQQWRNGTKPMNVGVNIGISVDHPDGRRLPKRFWALEVKSAVFCASVTKLEFWTAASDGP
jgi:hypothetical protein